MEIKDAANKLKQLNAGKNMANNKIKGFALRGIVEKMVSPETRARHPILNKLIPLTNYIACGAALVVVVIIAVVGFGADSPAAVVELIYQSISKILDIVPN